MDEAATSARRKSSASTISTTLSNAASPSTVSTPTSAGSPPANAPTPKAAASIAGPRVAIRPNAAVKAAPVASTPISKKPMAAAGPMGMPTSNEARPLSMTSKEWVIPPRPKPGRKPATDTPPTRRKAQNRAAQRAFRERRAARVGELEEQLEDQKEENDRLIRELQDRISDLELESQALQTKCQWLEGQLEQERMSKGTTGKNWDDGSALGSNTITPFDGPQSIQQTGPPNSQTTSPLEPTRPGHTSFSISQIISPPDELGGVLTIGCGSCSPEGPCACAEEVLASASLSMGCGNCGIGTRCSCLEESLQATVPVSGPRRRPGSPSLIASDGKRQRVDDTSAMETDFTAIFSSQRNLPALQASTHAAVITSVEPKDSCGFCKDGTYCVCADALATGSVLPPPIRQPPSAQTQTPPPSENDVVPAPMPMEVTATGAIKLPRISSMQRGRAANLQRPQATAASSRCGPNGPGTCAQCLADPKSGLFCRSLAANFERNNRGQAPLGGCCGQGGPGGCCKSGNAAAPPKTPGLSLSCAETYKTLASHRNFDEAADDIGTWLPKLKAVPTPEAQGSQQPIRLAPIEVEAASIMSVLKEFDVRFGRGE